MEAVRRYVFPIIWMIIFAVIAASLVRLAFFSNDQAGSGDEVYPTASIDEFAVVPVERGDIASTLVLAATVQADAGRAVPVTTAGEVVKVWASNGDTLSQGARILQVRVPRDAEPLVAPPGDDTEDAPAPVQPPAAPVPSWTYHDLLAPTSGTVRDLKAVNGQVLTLGDTVATLSPGTYAVIADLTPEQQLQLLDNDIEATATLPSMTTPIACSTPRIEEKDETEQDQQPSAPQIDPMTGMPMDSATSAARLRCPVPSDTKIVPGLTGEVSIDLGSATDTLVVPTTAVEGELTEGAVYVMGEGGEPERRDVTLGLRGDGVVEVTGGITEGEEILQFVPGVDNPEGDMYGGMGW
ncbi:MAG: HlyD family efflux transporter periplasmic adaptor subunit [Mobilicoccus sp.]|nr:HlyD family efflux transporter periplasmic adaptor subunit [Mobilicoccus sp.]